MTTKSRYKRYVYDKWDKGEFGNLNPSQAPNGSWTGKNMVVYKDGQIGPRPGLKQITVNNPSKNGPLLGLGFSPVAQAGNTPIFYILDDTVHSFDPGTATLDTISPTLGAAPDNTDDKTVLGKESVRLIGDEIYFTNNNDSTYRLNLRTQTLTDISGSADGTDIELYRDRMLVAKGVRVFYSDAADFDTWDAGSFFDVGAAYRIVNMYTFRDALLIFTLSGVWALTGTPDDGTLRRISEAMPANDKAFSIGNDEMFFVPSSRAAPVVFQGSYANEFALAHLEPWMTSTGASSVYGVHSYGNRDCIFVSDTDKMLWRKNNAWTFHDFSVTAGPWVVRFFDDYVLIADPGTSSTKPKFYMLWLDVNRPGFTSDTWAQPGDNSTTPLNAYFTLPTHLVEDGTEERVRSVTVDFTKYDTGSSTANNFDIVVSSQYRDQRPGENTVTKTGLFNEAGASATTTGVRQRVIYRGVEGAFGGGWTVGLTNIRGVKIDRIVVETESQDMPVT